MSVYHEGGVSCLCVVKEACRVFLHTRTCKHAYVYLEMSVKCVM